MLKENLKTVRMVYFSGVFSSRLFWIISFSILTAVSAQISIPVKPVPFTLQTMMVVLAGAFLGARNGAYSQILYLLLGITGLPVFAQTADMTYGITRLLGPTGGYLLAFPLAAYLTGYLVERYQNYFSIVFSMFSGNVVILLSGVIYLNFFFTKNWTEALTAGAVIFSFWTLIKTFVPAAIYSGVKKIEKNKH